MMAIDASASEALAVRPLDGHRDRLTEAGGPDIRLEIIEPKTILNLRGSADDPSFAEAVRKKLILEIAGPLAPDVAATASLE